MPTNTNGGTTVSFSNTPQGKDDNFTSAQTNLTEDSSVIVYLDVMANDLGGNAKSLWSVDNGINNSGAMNGYVAADLLVQDTVRIEATSSDTSLNGARIWITADGKVGYEHRRSARSSRRSCRPWPWVRMQPTASSTRFVLATAR